MRAALALALAALTACAAAQEDAKAQLWAKLSEATTQTARIKLLTNDSDFVFNFLDPTAERTQGAGGFIVSANSGTFPALFGHGMAMALGVLGPCSMNSPHTHPRATEFNVALNGTLYTGMLAENGARFVLNNVPTLAATVFPRGAIHFEANLGCQPVYFIAAFNDPDPGVLQVAQRFYGLPPAVVGQSLGGLGVEQVVSVAQKIPDNIIFAADECFQRCGIQKPASQPGKQQQPRVSGNAYPTGMAGGSAPAPPSGGGYYNNPGGFGAPPGAADKPAPAGGPSNRRVRRAEPETAEVEVETVANLRTLLAAALALNVALVAILVAGIVAVRRRRARAAAALMAHAEVARVSEPYADKPLARRD